MSTIAEALFGLGSMFINHD